MIDTSKEVLSGLKSMSLNRKGQERNWRSKVVCLAYEWKMQLSRVCCRQWAALRSGPLVRKAAIFQFTAGNFKVEISKAIFVWKRDFVY